MPLRRQRIEAALAFCRACGVRPVGFDCDNREAVFLDQPARDGSARPVKLRGSMGRFTEQHYTSVAEPVEGVGKAGSSSAGKRSAADRSTSAIDACDTGCVAVAADPWMGAFGAR